MDYKDNLAYVVHDMDELGTNSGGTDSLLGEG